MYKLRVDKEINGSEQEEAGKSASDISLAIGHSFLDSLVENLPLMVFVKDAATLNFVRLNKAGEDLVGVPRSEFIGKSDYDFFPKQQADYFVAKDRAVLQGRVIVDIPEESIMTKHLGPRILHTRKIPLFAEDGSPQFLLGISEDITEIKRAEEARLRMIREEAEFKEREKSERQSAFLAEASSALSSSLDYHHALQHLSDLIVAELCDWCSISVQREEGSFERVALKHRDKSFAPLLAKIAEINPIPEGHQAGIGQVLTTGKTLRISPISEEDLLKHAASEAHFKLGSQVGVQHYMVVPIKVRERVLGAIAFFSSSEARGFSASDQLFAEEIGRRAGMAIENALLFEQAKVAVQSRDEFLSIASHELKTPITSLKLQLQLTKRNMDLDPGGLPNPERLHKFMTVSLAQVDRLTRLVEDLLDVARIQAGKISFEFEETLISELVREVVERYSDPLKSVQCAVTLEIEPGLRARLDQGRIEQVMANLISNVIKYAPGAPVEIRVKKDGPFARVEIEDRGPGICKERLPRVFERFERAVSGRNISGLGLGLFITRRIVQSHGGSISVESEVGKGAKFSFVLPLL